MDTAWLSCEHQAEAQLASNESPQDETSRLERDDGGDSNIPERLSEDPTGCAEYGGVTEHSGEVGVSVRPAKGAEEQGSSCISVGGGRHFSILVDCRRRNDQ